MVHNLGLVIKKLVALQGNTFGPRLSGHIVLNDIADFLNHDLETIISDLEDIHTEWLERLTNEAQIEEEKTDGSEHAASNSASES